MYVKLIAKHEDAEYSPYNENIIKVSELSRIIANYCSESCTECGHVISEGKPHLFGEDFEVVEASEKDIRDYLIKEGKVLRHMADVFRSEFNSFKEFKDHHLGDLKGSIPETYFEYLSEGFEHS